jgi:hypothetical protein
MRRLKQLSAMNWAQEAENGCLMPDASAEVPDLLALQASARQESLLAVRHTAARAWQA